MTEKPSILDSRGLSMVDALVGLGLLGVLSLGTASMMSSASRSGKGVQQSADFGNLLNSMNLMLSNPSSCTASLAALRISPPTASLAEHCYTGLTPTFETFTSAEMANPSRRTPASVLGTEQRSGLLKLSSFCLTWKSTWSETRAPGDPVNGPPRGIRGLAAVKLGAGKEVGGNFKEREILIEIDAERKQGETILGSAPSYFVKSCRTGGGRSPASGDQVCAEGQTMRGIRSDGTPICDHFPSTFRTRCTRVWAYNWGGWSSHPWSANDCSDGLPEPGCIGMLSAFSGEGGVVAAQVVDPGGEGLWGEGTLNNASSWDQYARYSNLTRNTFPHGGLSLYRVNNGTDYTTYSRLFGSVSYFCPPKPVQRQR